MKPYFVGILAVIGLVGFVWLSMPPSSTDDARPLRVAMFNRSIGSDEQTVFLQWKSPRLKASDLDIARFPIHQIGGFGFANAAFNYNQQMPLIPDYLLITMPRWFLLCLTMLAPLAWLFERLARVAALRLTPRTRQCDHCGYTYRSHRPMCPICQTSAPLCQTA